MYTCVLQNPSCSHLPSTSPERTSLVAQITGNILEREFWGPEFSLSKLTHQRAHTEGEQKTGEKYSWDGFALHVVEEAAGL